MPRFSFDTKNYPESVEPPFFCTVIDGNGIEIPEVVLADTDTGEVIRNAIDAAGSYVIMNGEIALISEIRPLPLRLEPIGEITPHIVEASPTNAD